ncbi:MAG TPA: hypothetical protein VFO59_07590, partial [Dehalococcoidia bacterium]|nr:hypothetical protein [Dehalococcoidia bacterium]
DLDPGETVDCTFTNVKAGSITIVKDAVPNDPQDFSFTCSPPLGSFTLDDDADGTLNSTTGPVSVAAGVYSCSEASVSGWAPTSATCSDGSPVGAINVSPGENVTCTFVNTKNGSITIVKDVANPPGTHSQDFSFTCAAPLGNFSLDDDLDPALSNTQGPVSVAPGMYGCSEASVPLWTLTSATCSDGSPVNAINVGPGESVTCTFLNTKNGSITIVKDVANPPGTHPQDFSFTCSAPIGSFQLDDDADGTFSDTRGPTSVSAGTYGCSEAPTAGWVLTSATCSDGSPVSAINVSAAEDVTCTYVNAPVGNVVITKVCVGGNETFGFTGTLGAFALTCVGGGASQSFTNIPVGAKTVTESPAPAGWSFTGLTCGDPDNGTTTSGSTATIDLDAGETVTCTYTNMKSATVVIVKNTVPDSDQDFGFSCAGLGTFSLDDDADGTLPNTHQFDNVTPGSYTCTEANAQGYQTAVSCADPDAGSTGEPPTALIDADPGETVTCTFTNTFHPGPNPVGGILGLLDGADVSAPRESSRNTAPGGPDGLMLGAVGAGVGLLLAAAWVARRRLLR